MTESFHCKNKARNFTEKKIHQRCFSVTAKFFKAATSKNTRERLWVLKCSKLEIFIVCFIFMLHEVMF